MEQPVVQAVPATTPPNTMLETHCPLCGGEFKSPKRVLLNDVRVCKRCRNGFANRRQFAFILDWLIWRFGTVGVVMAIDILPFGEATAVLSSAAALLLPFTIIFRDGLRGISPGKWLTGVQAVDAATLEPIGFGRSAKRNLFVLIPLVGILVPAFQMIKGRRSGDYWAKTLVIWRKHAHKSPFDKRGILCMKCGYDLTGNVSGICPECGMAVAVPGAGQFCRPGKLAAAGGVDNGA